MHKFQLVTQIVEKRLEFHVYFDRIIVVPDIAKKIIVGMSPLKYNEIPYFARSSTPCAKLSKYIGHNPGFQALFKLLPR